MYMCMFLYICFSFMLFKISNMTELCCWISRNWACWICCACSIFKPVNQSLVFFFNFSSSWRNEILLSWLSEKCEIKSLDVNLRDPFLRTFTCIIFLSFSWSCQTFSGRHLAYLVPAQARLELWILFQLLLFLLQDQLYRIA